MWSPAKYDEGYYTAYKHLAQEDVDVVFHLGDYLYEYAVRRRRRPAPLPAGTLPSLFERETVTLEDYACGTPSTSRTPTCGPHAAHPFVVTWDDHETENNYADESAGEQRPAGGVPHPPGRRLTGPTGRTCRCAARNCPTAPTWLYRRLHWGRLAQFDVLDTRQYRSNQPTASGWQFPGPESKDPSRTLTGDAQERWLINGWHRSDALWNVVPQRVTFSQRYNMPTTPSKVSMDSWDATRPPASGCWPARRPPASRTSWSSPATCTSPTASTSSATSPTRTPGPWAPRS